MICEVKGAFIAIENRSFGEKKFNDLKVLVGSDTQSIGIPDDKMASIPELKKFDNVKVVVEVRAYNTKSGSAALGLRLESVLKDI